MSSRETEQGKDGSAPELFFGIFGQIAGLCVCTPGHGNIIPILVQLKKREHIADNDIILLRVDYTSPPHSQTWRVPGL